MKFFDIVWKEISLIKSQKIALLLIFLYPFLVIGLIGTAFTGIDVSQMKTNKVGVVNELVFAPDFTKQFSTLNQLSVIDFPDENSLVSAIKNKDIVAGLRLSGKSKIEQIRVDLYYDNSSLLASKYFLEIAKAMMQRITADLSQKELAKVWEVISNLAGSVGEQNQTMADFKSKLSSAGSSLDALEIDLNKLDFSEINNALASQKATISDFSSKNTLFLTQVNSFKASFAQVKQMSSDLNTQMANYNKNLQSISMLVGTIDASLAKTIVELSAIRDTTPLEADKNKLTQNINSLQSTRLELASISASANQLSLLAAELSNSGSNLNSTIARADELFSQVDAQSRSISSALGSSNTTIGEMSSKLSVFKSSIDEVKSLISESRQSKLDIESKLNASDSLLSSLQSELVNIKDIDPQVLAKPAVFYEKKIFNVDPFGILVSNSAVIVLILTCMLLTSILILLEKNQNVTQRLILSPTSRVTLLFGKIVGQLVIAWVETAIILSVAFVKIPLPFSIFGVNSLGFGLVSYASWFDIFFAITIISLSFISLGILISFFTKNQSTAILASLLIVVPMLFLSGVILPIEFMEPAMQFVSSVLPLTVANNILIGLIVKGYTLTNLLVPLVALFVFSLAIIIGVMSGKE
ncbi:MAG: ABC transporter permease [archaeon]